MEPSELLTVPLVIIGVLDNWRTDLIKVSAQKYKLKSPIFINYLDILHNKVRISEEIPRGAIVKIDSPDMDFRVHKAILEWGIDLCEPQYHRLTQDQINNLPDEIGYLFPLRQWYLGYCALLDEIQQQLDLSSHHQCMQSVPEIKIMLDKWSGRSVCLNAEIPIPPTFSLVSSFEDVLKVMDINHCSRIFFKPTHGSGAAGIVALRHSGDLFQAITTIQLKKKSDTIYCYNTKKFHIHNNQTDIRELIDELCKHRAYVEKWIPKATINGYLFDFRLLTIDSQVRHRVVRLSKYPMTNLHLTDLQGDFSQALELLGEERWKQIEKLCKTTMACFPKSLFGGIDLMVDETLNHQYIGEINAFGDLLLNCYDQDEDPFIAEIRSMHKRKSLHD